MIFASTYLAAFLEPPPGLQVRSPGSASRYLKQVPGSAKLVLM